MHHTNIYRYAREYADPYLGHGIGPVPGYGVSFLKYKNYVNLQININDWDPALPFYFMSSLLYIYYLRNY